MSWELKKYKVRIELAEAMLGTTPVNPSIWAEHIATKQAKALKKEGMSADEIKAEIESTVAGVSGNDELDTGKTTFMKDEIGYYVRDYFIKGFLKNSAKCMKEFGKVKQLRSKVRDYLHVRPRHIYVAKPNSELQIIERPLRAQTPQGERVAIARSESVPAGTILDFELHSLNGVITKNCIEALLDFGQYEGLGQWRGSGAGRFTVVEFKEI